MEDECPNHVVVKDGVEYRSYSVGSIVCPNLARAEMLIPIPDWTGVNTTEEIKIGFQLARTTKYICHICGRQWEESI